MTTTAVHTESRAIPASQVALVLVGFPMLYMANALMPWSRALFGNGDRHAWFAFWASAFVLHWTSVALVAVVMRRNRWTLRDVGIAADNRHRASMVLGALTAGAAAVTIRTLTGPLNALGVAHFVRAWSAQGAPHTTSQRVLWVGFGIFTAAFCEEFVYRGFGFNALKSRGRTVTSAAVLASLAWIAVHGPAGVFGFPGYALLALVLTGLVVRKDSLVPSMWVHVAIHVLVILGS